MKINKSIAAIFCVTFTSSASAQVDDLAVVDKLKIHCESGRSPGAVKDITVPLLSSLSDHRIMIFQPLQVGGRRLVANFEGTLLPDNRIRLGQAAVYTSITRDRFEELGESYFVSGSGAAERSLHLDNGTSLTVGKVRLVIDSDEIVFCKFTPEIVRN